MYLVGDSNAEPVIQCLMDVVQLYGDQFIFQQYIPFISESVSWISRFLCACVYVDHPYHFHRIKESMYDTRKWVFCDKKSVA